MCVCLFVLLGAVTVRRLPSNSKATVASHKIPQHFISYRNIPRLSMLHVFIRDRAYRRYALLLGDPLLTFLFLVSVASVAWFGRVLVLCILSCFVAVNSYCF